MYNKNIEKRPSRSCDHVTKRTHTTRIAKPHLFIKFTKNFSLILQKQVTHNPRSHCCHGNKRYRFVKMGCLFRIPGFTQWEALVTFSEQSIVCSTFTAPFDIASLRNLQEAIPKVVPVIQDSVQMETQKKKGDLRSISKNSKPYL